jgi:two-component system CheB/CheR fusion protein
MNEELQSTNDELEAMNDEQRERTEELDRLNLFLEGILGNLGIGVVVLDQQQSVRLWNESATDMWGLRGSEVDGQHFMTLDIGLPVDGLREAIRETLDGGSPQTTVTLDAVNRRGKRFKCMVRALSLVTPAGERYGVILLMSGLDGKLPAGKEQIPALD